MEAKNSELKKVIAYTDGSCRTHQTEGAGPGGCGVVLLHEEHEKELSEGFRLTTSNRMEIWAAIAALEALTLPKCAVTIYSDSAYLVNSVSQGWVYEWKRKGWKRGRNEEVANVDLWVRLLELLDQHEVKFVYVRGHDGNPYNKRADYLAKEALDRENLAVDPIYEQMNPPALF